MITFVKRRQWGFLSVVVFSLLLLFLTSFLQTKLYNTSVITGVLLLIMVIFLVLFNIRKRFSFLPLGRASTWLQIHIYVAWASIATYAIHTHGRWPNGGLESVVGILFMLVALSGIVGLILSRVLPSKLTEKGGNIGYGQILELKRKLKVETEQMVVNSVELTKKSTIADFYVDRVEYFFIGSKTASLNHLLGSKKHINPLLTRLTALRRYLNEDETNIVERLEEMIIRKDDLDYQYNMQRLLKVWLFTHIPLSYSLLLFGIVHGLLAWNFIGS